MADSFELFQRQLASAGNVLIVLPNNPNFDQVAAGLSFYLSLVSYGKPVSIACPAPMTVEFSRLVGANKVSQKLSNKNLNIRFTNYRADNVERISYNIENEEFVLSVIPKPDVSAPRENQIELSYSGFGADLVILVGLKNKEGLGSFSQNRELFDRGVFLLGTTPAQGISAQELVFPAASCTSEVAARIINRLGFPFDTDIAGNLYLGIQKGTDKFTSPKVSAETFELLAQLLRVKGEKREAERPERAPQPQEAPPEKKGKPPKDWLEPKVYKGGTLS